MARRPRGGPRVGTPGQAYPNRTDLNSQHSLPVRTVPGQTYGAQVQQQNAQRIVPMGAPPSPMGMAPSGGAAMGPSSPGPSAGSQPSPGYVGPGGLGSLYRPTERPNEPVTAGAKLGAGPGPEALPNPGAMTGGAMTQLLNKAAVASGSQALRSLAMTAAQQGR